MELRPRNTGEVDLSYSVPVQVERWDGDAWRDARVWPPAGAWLASAFGVKAGEVGEWEQLPHEVLPPDSLNHVEPGWYRLTKSFSAEPAGDLTLQPSVVVEIVAVERASNGDCGPSAGELSQLDPVDEGPADVTGDGRADDVTLYAHDRGISVLAETTDGAVATAWLVFGSERDLEALGSRALPAGQTGIDLAGNGRDEVLVRHEDGQVDDLVVLAWHDGDLRHVHQHNEHRWTLRAGADASRGERPLAGVHRGGRALPPRRPHRRRERVVRAAH